MVFMGLVYLPTSSTFTIKIKQMWVNILVPWMVTWWMPWRWRLPWVNCSYSILFGSPKQRISRNLRHLEDDEQNHRNGVVTWSISKTKIIKNQQNTKVFTHSQILASKEHLFQKLYAKILMPNPHIFHPPTEFDSPLPWRPRWLQRKKSASLCPSPHECSPGVAGEPRTKTGWNPRSFLMESWLFNKDPYNGVLK